jgi:cation-transporting ATPase 13A2
VSSQSFLDDVEMAHDEVFGGPMAESVPSSTSSFAHRRARADSTASFTYYQDEDEAPPTSSEDDSAILDDESELHFEEDDSVDLEAGELAPMRRSSSGLSRSSVRDRLLRNDSARTDGSYFERGQRTSQKLYIATEDLTIVVAGFRTGTLGYALYITICVLTLGLGYLLLRWLPRWYVSIIGVATPLQKCPWVVIEVSPISMLTKGFEFEIFHPLVSLLF